MRTRYFLSVLFLVAAFNACQKEVKQGSASSNDLSNGKKVQYMDQLTLATAATSQTAIDVTVTAGNTTGAPAGFSIQWMTQDQLAAYTGAVDAQGWPLDTTAFCKASFSGKAFLSRYNLSAGQSVTVTIGDLLFDNGASTNCPDGLTCGTVYLFRAFAHANSTIYRGPWSNIVNQATDACNANCIHPAGYWRNHCDEVIALVDGHDNGSGDFGLYLGTVLYTGQQICDILHQPSQGNGLILLAHEEIATKLSMLNGGVSDYCDTGLAAADALIGNKVVPPVGTGSLPANTNGQVGNLIAGMRCFNEHGGDHGHCQ